jgi:hypothetical protein
MKIIVVALLILFFERVSYIGVIYYYVHNIVIGLLMKIIVVALLILFFERVSYIGVIYYYVHNIVIGLLMKIIVVVCSPPLQCLRV